MAAIRKRGDLQWQVLVRKRGPPQQGKIFDTGAKARASATVIESATIRGVFSRTEAERTTLDEILARHERKVTPAH